MAKYLYLTIEKVEGYWTVTTSPRPDKEEIDSYTKRGRYYGRKAVSCKCLAEDVENAEREEK